ncbi:MAG: hypothetical protein NUV53_00315 [Patescibacteria group bacterium]|nr:hypothetical protein [Patescibacteria group bacterium]
MTTYKHTQIGYLMRVITLTVLVFFAWLQITVRAEPPSIDSGTNFAFTAIMALVLFILASFGSLTVSVDEQRVAIKFGFGIFRKKFTTSEIASVAQVRNHWYYGWGIRLWFWPRMWIFNVSGFDAVEIRMKNPTSAPPSLKAPDGHCKASAGREKIYRIGTDEPEKLETAIRQVIN